jgi:MoaA/NifB/PqqE/SkfB family radical SAM enzyme
MNRPFEVVKFDKKEHHFYVNSKTRIDRIKLEFPLSVSLQITRDCNLKCIYCSETGSIQNAPIAKVEEMISGLRGVGRIIVTGGEPLMRGDLIEILKFIKEMQFENVSLATNGVLFNAHLAENLVRLVDYVDVTIDGPRKIHNEIRGEYDTAVNGIKMLSNAGVAFSLVTVLFDKNVESILYVCQLADAINATQLKIVTPISKGRGKEVSSGLLSSDQLFTTFQKIKSEKERNGWTIRITLTDWNKVGEGHAILVYPNGDVAASPVPSQEKCVLFLGNILKENIKTIWRKYPYKQNHLNKYLEKTLYVC